MFLLDADVIRQGALHNPVKACHNQGGGDQKDQRNPGMNLKRHYDGAYQQEGHSGGKTDEHIHAILRQIYVIGNPGNQAACANRIGFLAGQIQNVGKDLLAQTGTKAKGGYTGKILADKAGDNAQNRKDEQQPTLLNHILSILLF